jgi:predicted lysophospholipase L1 biosynthesis ABC-type transport system permease subunit
MNARRRDTRRAVQRALRTGHADDARIDALARETADRTVRNKWLLILYAVLAVLQLALTIIRIADRDAEWQIAVSVVVTALFAGAAVLLWVTRRRSRRYLRNAATDG